MRVHGHEVLNYIIEHQPNQEELTQAVSATYGKEATFYACSGGDMNLTELIAFLEARGKFVNIDGKMMADPGKMCAHH
jgi:probable metal-binding protein